MTRHRFANARALPTLILLATALAAAAQEPRPQPPVERIGENLFKVGSMTVDTAKREVVVPGFVNDVARGGPLEFVANTKGIAGEPGWRAYESALEFDTDAVTFNLAMVLIGLDSSDAINGRNFDLEKGARAQIWMEWDAQDGRRTVRAEELLFNKDTEHTLTDRTGCTPARSSPMTDDILPTSKVY